MRRNLQKIFGAAASSRRASWDLVLCAVVGLVFLLCVGSLSLEIGWGWAPSSSPPPSPAWRGKSSPGFGTAALIVWERKVGGRCPSCGYSLAGNVSGVFPECGTPAR